MPESGALDRVVSVHDAQRVCLLPRVLLADCAPMIDRYDLSRVSRETLERLAKAAHERALESTAMSESEFGNALLFMRREARIPLRTRAEVDAEIVRVARSMLCGPYVSQQVCGRIALLCAEPTADPEPAPDQRPKCIQCGACWTPDNGIDATSQPCLDCYERRCAEDRRLIHPDETDKLVEQTLAADEPEPCGCEQTDALKAQLDRCRAIVRALRLGEISGDSAARALERELAGGVER